MTNIYVSNKAELISALSSAKGGDTIELKSGDYGSLEINNLDFNSYVTLKSADGNLGATFDDIEITNSSNIRFDGVHVDSPSNTGLALMRIDGSQNIDLINSELNGKVDNVYPISGPTFGVYVSNSSDGIRMENNYVHDVKNGLGFFGTTNLEVVGNRTENIGEDSFKFASVKYVLVENNTGPSYIYRAPDAHADFMQFQGAASSDVVIRGNVFLPQNEENSQGIFLSGQGGHTNITIEQNIIYTAQANGIAVDDGKNVVIRYNTLINHLDDEQSTTRINAVGATKEYNIYTRKVGDVSGTNVVMQHLDEDGDFHYSDLYTGLTGSGGITLEDLIPVSGSAAETSGAYARIAELLGQSSGGNPPPVEPEVDDPEVVEPGVDEPDVDEPQVPVSDVAGAIIALTDTYEISQRANVMEFAPTEDTKISAGTMALTFNASSTSGTHGLVSKDASQFSGGGNHFTSYINDGVLYVRFQDGDSSATFQVQGIKANTDYDLQVSFGEGSVSVWLDGVSVGTKSFDTSWLTNNEYLQVGGNGWSSDTGESGFTHIFDGKISNFVLVEGNHSPEDLKNILNGGHETPVEGDEVIEEPAEDEDVSVVPGGDAPSPQANVVFEMASDTNFSRSTSDIVNVEHDSALEISEGTIALSFVTDNARGLTGILSKDASFYEGGDHFSAWIKNGKLNVRFQDEDSDASFVVRGIKAGQEYDLLAYFDDDEVGLYLDGKLIGSKEMDYDWEANQEYLQIGGLGWSSAMGQDDVTKAFDGKISDVTIVDQAILPSEYDFFS